MRFDTRLMRLESAIKLNRVMIPGKILFFDESSYPGPDDAMIALEQMKADNKGSKLVRVCCQDRKGTVYQDMVVLHEPFDLISE